MRPRRRRLEPVGEILRFVSHLPVAKLHDAYRPGWHAVIGQDKFGDPEVAAADHSPDRETFLVGLDGAALLNVPPGADALARLRIIKHGVVMVDVVFSLEVARIRSGPVAFQPKTYGLIIHLPPHGASTSARTGHINGGVCRQRDGC